MLMLKNETTCLKTVKTAALITALGFSTIVCKTTTVVEGAELKNIIIPAIIKNLDLGNLSASNTSFNNKLSDTQNISTQNSVFDISKRNLVDNLTKLKEISSLKYNWNGNGATPFSSKFIDRIRIILNYIEIQPEIFPTACNSIQFEYDGPNNSYLELEIREDKKEISIFKINRVGEEREFSIKSEPSELNKLINGFYG